MKLPGRLQEAWIVNRNDPANYRGLARTGARGIQPAALSSSCLSNCVGPTAGQCAHCGSDESCWSECAGTPALPCIRKCL